MGLLPTIGRSTLASRLRPSRIRMAVCRRSKKESETSQTRHRGLCWRSAKTPARSAGDRSSERARRAKLASPRKPRPLSQQWQRELPIGRAGLFAGPFLDSWLPWRVWLCMLNFISNHHHLSRLFSSVEVLKPRCNALIGLTALPRPPSPDQVKLQPLAHPREKESTSATK